MYKRFNITKNFFLKKKFFILENDITKYIVHAINIISHKKKKNVLILNII